MAECYKRTGMLAVQPAEQPAVADVLVLMGAAAAALARESHAQGCAPLYHASLYRQARQLRASDATVQLWQYSG